MKVLWDILLNRTYTVGIDIGSSILKLVQVLHQKDKDILTYLSMKELPEGVIEDGQIKDREKLYENLESLIREAEESIGKIKNVVFTITSSVNKGIFIDRVEDTISKKEDITEWVSNIITQRNYASAEENITFDYKIIDKEASPQDDTMRIKAIVVTIKDSIVHGFVNVLKDLEINPMVMDIEPLAVFNVWYVQKLPEDLNKAIMIVNIGEVNSEAILVNGGEFITSRTMSAGTGAFIRDLQTNLKISREEAISILKGDLPDGIDESIADEVVFYNAEEFTGNIDMTLRHFNNEILKKETNVQKIVLTGGGATIFKFDKFVERRLKIPTHILNPFNSIEIDEDLEIDTEGLKQILPLFTTVIGLGLRRIEEV